MTEKNQQDLYPFPQSITFTEAGIVQREPISPLGRPISTSKDEYIIEDSYSFNGMLDLPKALSRGCSPSLVIYNALKSLNELENISFLAHINQSIEEKYMPANTAIFNISFSEKIALAYNIDLNDFRFENGQTTAHKLLANQDIFLQFGDLTKFAKSTGLRFDIKDNEGRLPSDIYKDVAKRHRRSYLSKKAYAQILAELKKLEQEGDTYAKQRSYNSTKESAYNFHNELVSNYCREKAGLRRILISSSLLAVCICSFIFSQEINKCHNTNEQPRVQNTYHKQTNAQVVPVQQQETAPQTKAEQQKTEGKNNSGANITPPISHHHPRFSPVATLQKINQ